MRSTDNNPYSPAEETAVADGIVSGVQRLAFPAKFDQAFGYAALVARILIDWTPALGRPADDLDPEGFAVIDQTAITLKDAFCHC